GTAWAASSGLLSLMSAMNIVYNVKETRSIARRVGLALVMVMILAILVISTFGLLSAANRLDRGLLAHSVGFAPGGLIWRVGRKIISAMLAGVSIAILDRFMPNQRRPWRRSWPGVTFIVVLWMCSTTLFNLYAEHFASFN